MGAAGRLGVVVALLLASLALTAPEASAQPGPESGSSNWRQVSAGARHTCGVRTDRRLYCWGDDDFGQLGDGGTNTDRPTPVQVAIGGTDWATVSAGAFHTCARKTTGLLLCWGSDGQGELGDGGANAGQDIPVEVAGGATNWALVSAGNSITCARKTNGRLYCWGYDEYGALGNDAALVDRSVPTQVAGNATDWASVSPDGFHTCARRTTGRLYCWGRDPFGELGDGPGDSSSGTPIQVAGNATNWASVSVGSRHTCARRTTGRISCWGADDEGNLGNGPGGSSSFVPVAAAGGATDWASVSAGQQHTCARKTNRHLYCWGYSGFGGLGNGGGPVVEPSPVEVAGRAGDWTAVDGGQYHTCARITTGRLFCWGLNDNGQLGDGEPGTNTNRPVQVLP